ncbi:stage V sporulation protein D [Halalkalibacillus halophilus]|uniref:stage V sporulation protein D n=1 Tax=Halalkalibacillus halophilus TaxID=392827 RepID=UPI0003FCEE7A|nr:stage V sporulation protein D [Halalkalibacillus halophilus]
MKRITNVTVRKRMIAVFFLISIYFLIMFFKLGYVQLITGSDITARAENLWSRDIPFQPDRGKIVDRNGEVLVDNQVAPSLAIVPRQIVNVEDTTDALLNILDVDREKLVNHLTNEASVEMIHPEGRKLSREQANQIRELNLPGLYLAHDSEREYPYGENLAHVLGFTGIDNQGLMGLEAQYEDVLAGDSGALSFYSDAKGRRLTEMSNIYNPPEDGEDLQLTIDASIQAIVERELDQAMATYNPDQALAIVMDPNNGEVLAMSSRPTFDPANYQLESPEVYNRNLPVFSTFEPGSTFKIITLSAALEENLIDLEEDTYYDKGYVRVGGSRLRCWHKGGHGQQTYLEVVQHSCNPGFVNLGQMLGKDRLFEYIETYGFGEKTGIDLQGESTGIMFSDEQIGPVELATTAFGQGVSVTPIQQVSAVAAAINGGYLYEPSVVKGEENSSKETSSRSDHSKFKRQVISNQTSELVRGALENVVAQGTGRGAYVNGYRVGGKTGTAQKVGPSGGYSENEHIVSFIGFAPADDPELLVYVAIDNPQNTIQFGGVVASPIGGRIIGDSLRYLDVPLREDGLDKEYQWPELPEVDVPDLIGETPSQLQQYLTNIQIDVEGEGEQVISQTPAPGVKVETGSTVRVYMGDE